jgi:hypothetical protein
VANRIPEEIYGNAKSQLPVPENASVSDSISRYPPSGRAGADRAPALRGRWGLITGFYFFNTGAQAAKYSISFHDDNGAPVALSITGLGTRTSISDTFPAHGSMYYEAGSPSGVLLSGSGAITADCKIMFVGRGTKMAK